MLFSALVAALLYYLYTFSTRKETIKEDPNEKNKDPIVIEKIVEKIVHVEKEYPSEPLERLGVKLKDVLLEEGVSPQIVANTVAFAVRSMISKKAPNVPSVPSVPSVPTVQREPDAKRTIIPDLPTAKPKRKPVTLGPIEVEETKGKLEENPRLKKLIESRERIEEEMRSKGAIDPKEPLKP